MNAVYGKNPSLNLSLGVFALFFIDCGCTTPTASLLVLVKVLNTISGKKFNRLMLRICLRNI